MTSNVTVTIDEEAPLKQDAAERDNQIADVIKLPIGKPGLEFTTPTYGAWKTAFYKRVKDTGLKFSFRRHAEKSDTWKVWRIA